MANAPETSAETRGEAALAEENASLRRAVEEQWAAFDEMGRVRVWLEGDRRQWRRQAEQLREERDRLLAQLLRAVEERDQARAHAAAIEASAGWRLFATFRHALPPNRGLGRLLRRIFKGRV